MIKASVRAVGVLSPYAVKVLRRFLSIAVIFSAILASLVAVSGTNPARAANDSTTPMPADTVSPTASPTNTITNFTITGDNCDIVSFHYAVVGDNAPDTSRVYFLSGTTSAAFTVAPPDYSGDFSFVDSTLDGPQGTLNLNTPTGYVATQNLINYPTCMKVTPTAVATASASPTPTPTARDLVPVSFTINHRYGSDCTMYDVTGVVHGDDYDATLRKFSIQSHDQSSPWFAKPGTDYTMTAVIQATTNFSVGEDVVLYVDAGGTGPDVGDDIGDTILPVPACDPTYDPNASPSPTSTPSATATSDPSVTPSSDPSAPSASPTTTPSPGPSLTASASPTPSPSTAPLSATLVLNRTAARTGQGITLTTQIPTDAQTPSSFLYFCGDGYRVSKGAGGTSAVCPYNKAGSFKPFVQITGSGGQTYNTDSKSVTITVATHTIPYTAKNVSVARARSDLYSKGIAPAGNVGRGVFDYFAVKNTRGQYVRVAGGSSVAAGRAVFVVLHTAPR